jgi:hypothetical protein
MIIISIETRTEDIYTSNKQDLKLGIDKYVIHFRADNLELELDSEQATELCKKLKQHLEAGKNY